MSNDDPVVKVAFAIICLGVAVLGLCLLKQCYNNDVLKQEAIEHEYAQHNPKTGEWEWLEPEKRNE